MDFNEAFNSNINEVLHNTFKCANNQCRTANILNIIIKNKIHIHVIIIDEI